MTSGGRRSLPKPPPPKPPLPAAGFVCLSATAVVTNTLSPTTIGHDQAYPGTWAFQLMFLSALHSVGSCFSALVAEPLGPRNWVQSAAHVEAVSQPRTTMAPARMIR